MTLLSLAGDELLLRAGPGGLAVCVIPAEPPFESHVLDVFQLGMKHSTVARFRMGLRESGSFTTDDRRTQATFRDGLLSISFQGPHSADQRWTAVFGANVTTAILDAADRVLGERRSQGGFQANVNRHADCPCGSGRRYKRCCLAKDAAAAAGASSGTARDRRMLVQEIAAAVPLPTLRNYAKVARQNADILNDPRFWDDLGMDLGRSGYFAEARRAQQIGVALAPDDAPLLCNLAVSLSELGELEAGLQMLENVPLDAPQSAVIRANLLLKAGRLSEAVPHFEQAIAEEPEFDLPYLNLIEALEQLGSPQAEVWLRRAAERLQASPDVALAWAEHLHRHDRLEELAEADWIDTLASRAGDTRIIGERAEDARRIVAAQLWRGCARLMVGDVEIRVEELVRLAMAHKELGGDCDPLLLVFSLAVEHGAAVSLDRVFPLICDDCRAQRLPAPLSVFRAQTLLVAREWALARDEALVALGDSADHPAALHVLWWSLDELGDHADALAAAERFALIKPDDANIEYNLGLLAGSLGEHGRAAFHYTRQLTRFPEHAYAQENLAITLLLQGQFERAEAQFAAAQSHRHDFQMNEVNGRQRGVQVAGPIRGIGSLPHELRLAFEAELSQHILERQRSIHALLAFARSAAGRPTYVRDLIAFNTALEPSLGSWMREPQAILTADAMIGAMLESSDARRAELIAALQRHQRGDRSPIVSLLEQHLRWDGLPDAARESLLEGESRFHDGLTRDHAPTVVSYAKAVEVTLQATLFRPLRDSLSGADREALAREGRKSGSDRPLCRFLGDGRAPALGEMLYSLKQAATELGNPSLTASALLRRYAARVELDHLLSADFLARGFNLSSMRNTAAHEERFKHDSCADVRKGALLLLGVLTGFGASSPLESRG